MMFLAVVIVGGLVTFAPRCLVPPRLLKGDGIYQTALTVDLSLVWFGGRLCNK